MRIPRELMNRWLSTDAEAKRGEADELGRAAAVAERR